MIVERQHVLEPWIEPGGKPVLVPREKVTERTCGHRFPVVPPGDPDGLPVCDCGQFAIGRCQSCQKPVCGERLCSVRVNKHLMCAAHGNALLRQQGVQAARVKREREEAAAAAREAQTRQREVDREQTRVQHARLPVLSRAELITFLHSEDQLRLDEHQNATWHGKRFPALELADAAHLFDAAGFAAWHVLMGEISGRFRTKRVTARGWPVGWFSWTFESYGDTIPAASWVVLLDDGQLIPAGDYSDRIRKMYREGPQSGRKMGRWRPEPVALAHARLYLRSGESYRIEAGGPRPRKQNRR